MVQIASNTDIANLALSHLAHASSIGNLDEDEGAEANTINRLYTIVLFKLLRAWPWPFATNYVRLVKLEDDPTSEWRIKYAAPTDSLDNRRIFSGQRDDNAQTRIEFILGSDANGPFILTDEAEACLEYTRKEETVVRWPPDFQMGFSLMLAHFAAPRLTGGDPFALQQRLQRQATDELEAAAAKAFNEEQRGPQPDSEFVRSRVNGLFGDLRRTFRISNL